VLVSLCHPLTTPSAQAALRAHGPPGHTRDWTRIPSLRGPRLAIEDRLATSPHTSIHCEPGSRPAMRGRQIGQPGSNTIWESDQQNQIRHHNAWAANSARWYPVKVRAGLTTSNYPRLNWSIPARGSFQAKNRRNSDSCRGGSENAVETALAPTALALVSVRIGATLTSPHTISGFDRSKIAVKRFEQVLKPGSGVFISFAHKPTTRGHFRGSPPPVLWSLLSGRP
jgi:hypothetical protein